MNTTLYLVQHHNLFSVESIIILSINTISSCFCFFRLLEIESGLLGVPSIHRHRYVPLKKIQVQCCAIVSL